jgi:hypothetical protein
VKEQEVIPIARRHSLDGWCADLQFALLARYVRLFAKVFSVSLPAHSAYR